MSDHQFRKFKFRITGTHCQSCEVLVEHKLKDLEGVKSVHVNHHSGKIKVMALREPTLEEMNGVIQEDGYLISYLGSEGDKVFASLTAGSLSSSLERKRSVMEIGGILVIVLALYLLFKQFDFLPASFGIGENVSFGFAFAIGLVAALSSCIAVTGGLLVAVAGKYNEAHPNLSGLQKFKPQIYFNIGRVVSYAVLGGMIGLIGSTLTFSPKVMGWLTIFVSLIMILLGLQLLKIFPSLSKIGIRMPKFIARKVHSMSTTESKTGPFILGAGTFFLPCGFTQALQLYVLSKGDFWDGALIMFFFALGTVPALVSLGMVSSFAKGSFQRYFLKVAGVVVIILGIFNVNNGFNLSGLSFASSNKEIADLVEIVDGKQIAEMRVEGLQYTPSRFTVLKGVPVQWRIDGSGAEGCAQVVTAPGFGITEFLPPGEVKVVEFMPEEVGEFGFSCTMGMTTPGAAFVVVDGDEVPEESVKSVNESVNESEISAADSDSNAKECDPTVTSCTADSVQKLSMEISEERGFYPDSFTMQKGVPVELTIDTQVPLGGCMGTMIVPEFDVAHNLKLGKTVMKFTPDKAGEFPFMCSMGIVFGEFKVVEA